MREEEFGVLTSLLHRSCGLSLDDSKAEFIASRLKPVAARHGLRSIETLVEELRAGNEPLSRAVIEAVTINDTGFFRDAGVFAALPRSGVAGLGPRARKHGSSADLVLRGRDRSGALFAGDTARRHAAVCRLDHRNCRNRFERRGDCPREGGLFQRR